ncbi:hypothetical protein [Streptomyces sp. ISL-94]|uniref:hypothetical protein n=1 Tax=Streptomyces sp. ISL-94 TaxID=2819190 RepID=UPI001BE6BA19|nr:hypothetical protein [Streptomyces sp. ISL-94]MBT2480478.1 hypothetical protein [Streptomyces sp. ISL-94]
MPDRRSPQGRRARAAALREQAGRAERRRRRRLTLIVSIVVAVVIAGLTIAVLSTSGGPSRSTAPEAGIPATPMNTASGRTTSPPWAASSDASARVAAAGLPMLGEEGNVEHIHVHLDVIVNGKPVAVPGNIGIDQKAQQISPLHTHVVNGVIHVESPGKALFSLGQFMTEWDVALTPDSIGGLKAGGGNEFHAYVNGKERPGNPAAIELRNHDEIALVYGPADVKVDVPSSYDWPKGK